MDFLSEIRGNNPFIGTTQQQEEEKKKQRYEEMSRDISGSVSPSTVTYANFYEDFYKPSGHAPEGTYLNMSNDTNSDNIVNNFWSNKQETINKFFENIILKKKGEKLLQEKRDENDAIERNRFEQDEFNRMRTNNRLHKEEYEQKYYENIMNSFAKDVKKITGVDLNREKFENERTYRESIILNMITHHALESIPEGDQPQPPPISSHYSGIVNPETNKRRLVVPMGKVNKSITSSRRYVIKTGGKKTRKRKIKKTKKYKRQKKSLTKSKKKRSKK